MKWDRSKIKPRLKWVNGVQFYVFFCFLKEIYCISWSRVNDRKIKSAEISPSSFRFVFLILTVHFLDGSVGIVFQFPHFDVAEIVLLGLFGVVVKQVPFGVNFNDRVVGGPAHNRTEDFSFVYKRPIRGVTNGVA